MNVRKHLTVAITCGLYFVMLSAYGADIRMPAIFGDNMVLQRNIKVPLWGWAAPNEKIRIQFKNKTFKTTADSVGKWRVKLDMYAAGGSYQMLIEGETTKIMIRNILIGDVWLGSGQSNMELGIQTERSAAEAIANATDTLIHFFYVPMTFSLQPQTDIVKQPADSPNGKWVVCSPQLLANPKWAWHGFSAVCYYFALQMRKSTQCPVGMIATYKGGTPAQAWISVEGLTQAPVFTGYLKKHQLLVDSLDNARFAYPELLSHYKTDLKTWQEEIGNDYEAATKQWRILAAQVKANGQVPPVQPKPVRPAPKEPASPEGGFSAPGNLYNAMIAPIVPYGIKGILWYQGESNGDKLADAVEYKTLFPRLITDWRSQWSDRNLPFLFVQLPNFRSSALTPSQDNWPWVREAQAKALSLPNTGMAVTIDLGEAENIHPTNKKDVGNRLALVARHVVYGENLIYSGPVFKSMKVEGNKIRIVFAQPENGLTVGTSNSTIIQELKGFGIAGDDQKFVWAKAVIDGNTVIVSSEEVNHPVAVRYNWADNPPGNLYNSYGLPCQPFRTDDWAAPLNEKNAQGVLR